MTKILVIEDEAMLREDILEWLTLEGYEAIGAADGVEGVNHAFLHQPDLIVCDINMPQLDGYEVLIEVQANSITRSTPFIFLTAKADPGDIRSGMQLGSDDYLTKPFNRLDLLRTIQTRLDKKTVQDREQQQQVELFKEALTYERTQRLLQTKLVAMFSHDFRNPLTAIISSNNLLRDYGNRMDSERQKTHFNRVEASAYQLIQMLDDMLLIAQMETGKLDFEPEPLDVDEFLHRIVEEFQSIHGETYQLIYESHFNDVVMADPRLLRQIAANFISNAIKYSPQGSSVHVLLEHRDRKIVLTVRDQGIGIPEKDQARLFNAFQRASNVGEVQGTGLGLAIVKQAVDLHGGSITFESQVGVGTTFTVHLPLHQTPETNS